MRMLQWYERITGDHQSDQSDRRYVPPILAKLTAAKCIDVNRYIYAWEQVTINNDNTATTTVGGVNSTGGVDEWDYAALNLVEVPNTVTYAGAGVDMGGAGYPEEFDLQAFGGGSCSGTGCSFTLNGQPVVVIHRIGGPSVEDAPRFVFGNTNEHDGQCGTAFLQIADGADVPDAVPNYAHIYVNDTNGDLYFKDADGNTKVIVTDT